MNVPELYYGVAYYAEYLPCDRMEEDLKMIRAAGFNVIRIGESTWSTWEPQDGVFDFTLLHAMLDAAARHGLSVIVGTPTYAIPPWLAKKYPDILAVTHDGPQLYGHRQNMDITHPGYLAHCERIILRMAREVADAPNVIGWQLDNETKAYDTCSPRAQAEFFRRLKARYGTVEALNDAMGLPYWSNAVGSWDDLPDVRGAINASYGAAYQKFQRELVSEFHAWQASLLRPFLRPGQFLTHNFDFAWNGYSCGLQPEVDQFADAACLDVAGADIYHPAQDALTGAEISFGGDLARSLKRSNYFVLETQAQGRTASLPYPGQLRLCAYAHLACGANMVEYWHWSSIHNACESYWKGVVSHDGSAGAVYREASAVGAELKRLSPRLKNLRVKARAALFVSNRSQAGVGWFPTGGDGPARFGSYNEALCSVYDALYRANIPCDLLDADGPVPALSGYELVVLPTVYAMGDALIEAVCAYAAAGGRVLALPRTAFADEALKIRHDAQPHGLTALFGVTYDTFTNPINVGLCGEIAQPEGAAIGWMEHLRPAPDTEVLARYLHPAWGSYAALTLHRFGGGCAAYLGCYLTDAAMDAVLTALLPRMGLALPQNAPRWPLVIKRGQNDAGKTIVYCLNFSAQTLAFAAPCTGRELLTDTPAQKGASATLAPWGVAIYEAEKE